MRREGLEVNLVSFMLLNNAFLSAVGGSKVETSIINITSLAAIKGLPSMALYCTGTPPNPTSPLIPGPY